MTQTLIVDFVLMAALGYAVWKFCQLWGNPSDCCHGCDGCTLKKQICDKKRDEKFGESK